MIGPQKKNPQRVPLGTFKNLPKKKPHLFSQLGNKKRRALANALKKGTLQGHNGAQFYKKKRNVKKSPKGKAGI